MANYSELLNDINAAIYENNDQEIDALEVRAILREMVTSLGSGFLFKGIATPSSPSGTGTYEPDQNVFYLATTAGTYSYLGGLVVAAGEVAFLCFDGTWTKKSTALLSKGSIVDNTTTDDATKPLSAKQGKVLADTGAATAAQVSALGHKVDENAAYSSTETVLNNSSPYYVSSLSGTWMNHGANAGKITVNQYTTTYTLILFRLPAGKYILKTTPDASSNVGVVFGTIESEADLVVGNTVDVLVTGDGTAQSHIFDFEEETLLVFLSGTYNYSSFGSASELQIISIKEKVTEHEAKIAQLEGEVSAVPELVDEVFIEETLQDSDLVMGYVNSNGLLNSYSQESGFWRSGYIYCGGAIRASFVNVANNMYISSYAIYDKDKNLLQNVVGSSGSTTSKDYDVDLTQISGAYYLAFTITTRHKNAQDWGVTIRRPRIAELENAINPLGLEILIPENIFAVVGTELNLWNDAISLSIDNSLYSPRNYVVEWKCNKGLITKRGYRFTPVAGYAGNSYTCECTIFDSLNHNQIATKAFTIQVLAKDALSSSKNIVHFGDSLGESTAAKLYDNFNDSQKYTGAIPKMLGTRGSGAKRCEAVGGWTWESYATAGVVGYRISVSGVTSINVGAIYTDGSHNFEVYEVNITEGTGNCLLGKHYTSSGALIMPSGTLTLVSGSGDNTVPYTGAYQESVNPLWNDTTQQLDINQYKQMLVSLGQLDSVSDKIDAVSFQFGVNESIGTPNFATILNNYIVPLYNLFVTDNPNCKFIVGLTTSAGNDVDGAGVNYGASRDTWKYLRNTYNFRKMYLEELQGNTNYPNLVIAPSQLLVDRYYGYALSTRPISQRTTETEQYHNNFVHPGADGYGQLADALFATYIGALV